jgi:hypothetical protein
LRVPWYELVPTLEAKSMEGVASCSSAPFVDVTGVAAAAACRRHRFRRNFLV